MYISCRCLLHYLHFEVIIFWVSGVLKHALKSRVPHETRIAFSHLICVCRKKQCSSNSLTSKINNLRRSVYEESAGTLILDAQMFLTKVATKKIECQSCLVHNLRLNDFLIFLVKSLYHKLCVWYIPKMLPYQYKTATFLNHCLSWTLLSLINVSPFTGLHWFTGPWIWPQCCSTNLNFIAVSAVRAD